MTDQEQFDYVVRNLATQGKPAADEKGRCQYRARDGGKCAAGQLIPDADYDPQMEGRRASAVITRYPALSWINPDLANCLQTAHDQVWLQSEGFGSFVTNTPDFVKELNSIAQKYSLDPSVIIEAFPNV